MYDPNDINQYDDPLKSRKHKGKPDPKRLGRLATLAFMGISFLGGFIGGGEVERIKTPPPSPPPTVVLLVQSPQDVRNLSEDLSSILKRAADKKISVEEAVIQIFQVLRITLSNIDLVDQIRRIVEKVVAAGTDGSIVDALEELSKVLASMSTPSPSPIPTGTIVFPSRR